MGSLVSSTGDKTAPPSNGNAQDTANLEVKNETNQPILKHYAPKYEDMEISKYTKISPTDADEDDNKQLLFDFISHFCRKYSIKIPSDLIKLCLRFYQSKFEWTINTKENEDQKVYFSRFEIESKSLNIIATASAKFEINEFSEMCMFSISSSQLTRRNYKTKLFCHVRCDELNYEWKYTSEKGDSALCAFSQLPKGEVTLECYFRILRMCNSVPTINDALYEWVLEKTVTNAISECVHRRFYSPNILNGWICFSLTIEGVHRDDTEDKRELTFRVHQYDKPKNEYYRGVEMRGHIFVLDADKQQLSGFKFDVAELTFNKHVYMGNFVTTKDVQIDSIIILLDYVKAKLQFPS